MIVRPQRDGEVVAPVIAAAFEDAEIAVLWDDVVGRGLARASLVAVEGEVVVGHVGLSHAWLDARRELVDVVILSPLSVQPERQHSGIGTALVQAAIDAARAAKVPALFLEGSPDYYSARGFSAARPLGFAPPTDRIPGPAFQVVVLDGWEDWMTGRLVYHDVWWEHGAAGLRDPMLGDLERRFGS